MKQITIHPLEETELSVYQGEVNILTEQAKTLLTVDDASEGAATLFIAGCKKLQADMDDDRKKRVAEMNKEVKAINESYHPFDEVLDKLWRVTDAAKSVFLVKKARAIEEANRKAIADAEQKKREKELKEKQERDEAERLRLEADRLVREETHRQFEAEMERKRVEEQRQADLKAVEDAAKAGDAQAELEARERANAAALAEQERLLKDEMDRLAAQEEQARLEKQAARHEVKADMAQSQALTVAPQLHDAESATATRTLSNGTKVGARREVKWAFENGLAIDGDFYQDDPRLQDIPPRYFLLDTKKLGKDVKNGVPVPGCIRIEGMATTLRK